MESTLFCLHLSISGHVQGVGFRVSLQEQARALRLQGWVRNCGDGRVEALVQGPRQDVDVLRQWCRHGPPAARVQAVTATEHAVDRALPELRCVATA